ncbi:MAG: hypothetical protein U5K51_09120 [Flavobacteriaceae bacterium]|nr:hypothetical protein [Flavobacteriaceae bacterium]
MGLDIIRQLKNIGNLQHEDLKIRYQESETGNRNQAKDKVKWFYERTTKELLVLQSV